MSYALTIGSVHVLTDMAEKTEVQCDCHGARDFCMPSFVFSVEGQIGFRTALQHLAMCRARDCHKLKNDVFASMKSKVIWLLKEECLLGCVHVQPMLYGAKKTHIQRKDLNSITHHLGRCPKESCAQLRRALLLTIRDDLRPKLPPPVAPTVVSDD